VACVYSITNTSTNQLYVGSTICLVRKRWNTHKNHLRKNKHANPRLQNSWNKYGEGAFEFTVLAECSREEARILEKEYVERLKPAFNLVPVGALPSHKRILSEEQKQQLRSRFKGIPLTEEHRRRIAIANTGYRHSEETRDKMAKRKLGTKWSEETRRKRTSLPKRDAFWTFNGETKRFSEWEKLCGVEANTIRTRVRNGWAAEKVLSPVKFRRKPAPKAFFQGVLRTLKECAAISGLKESMIRERIYCGWAPEDAVSIPKGGKR